jgi:predicted ATPase with chaperone activity
VDVTSGLPSFSTVGFPDSTVRERRDGVPAAIEIPVAPITWRADLQKVRISPRAVRG